MINDQKADASYKNLIRITTIRYPNQKNFGVHTFFTVVADWSDKAAQLHNISNFKTVVGDDTKSFDRYKDKPVPLF